MLNLLGAKHDYGRPYMFNSTVKPYAADYYVKATQYDNINFRFYCCNEVVYSLILEHSLIFFRNSDF